MTSTELNSTLDIPAGDARRPRRDQPRNQRVAESRRGPGERRGSGQAADRLRNFRGTAAEEGTDNLYIRFAIGHRREVVEHWRIPMGDGIIGAAAATRPGDSRRRRAQRSALPARRRRGPLGDGRSADRARARDRRDGHRKPPAGLFHAQPANHPHARRQPHRHRR